MGKKEKILELIKEFEGLNYNQLLKLYNERYNPDTIKRKSAYSYLKRLKKAKLIENDNGKNITYKATPKALNQDTTENYEVLDKVVETLVKSGVVSEKYGVEISEKEIEPSIKRLEESGRLG
jgi:predicted transcriptional regulator